MKRDLSKIFIDEIYFKPPKKNYPTNKTIVKHVDQLLESRYYSIS